jgi:Tol biopolymer transport system component
MTSERRFDQDLPDLLAQVAQAPAPDYRDQIVQRTARIRQRPAWTFPERWLPMSAVTSRAAIAPRVPLRIVGLVALLLLALIVGAVLIGGSQRHVPAPFGPAANGRVAFAKGGDIYTADPVSGVATAVVTGPETNVGPVWSRDGTRFVFEREVTSGPSNARLFVARADGSGLVAITSKPQANPSRFAFSPDGTEVVYTAGPAASELWIAKTDGSGARQIDVGMSVRDPRYRPPNGDEIVFASANGVGDGIYAVDVATNNVRTIVAPSAGVGLDVVGVAPDGSRVAYSAASTNDTTRNTYRVQVRAIDGSGTTLTLPMPQGATFQDAPAWSNDSTRIVVTRGYSTHNQEMTLAVLPADGSGSAVGVETARGLTGCCDTLLEWAPDDKSILVSPEDLDQVIQPQLLLDPATGLTRATPWAAIGDPAWQRVAP